MGILYTSYDSERKQISLYDDVKSLNKSKDKSSFYLNFHKSIQRNRSLNVVCSKK
jgi:hypothetical protein